MGLAKRINQLSSRDFGDDFVDAMNLTIKDLYQPRPSRPNVKPSKAGCLRQMYYILIDAPIDTKDSVDPSMKLIQEDGSYMHTVIQSILSSENAKKFGLVMLDPKAEVLKAQQKGINTVIRPSTHSNDDPFELLSYNEDYGVSFKWDGVGIFQKKKFILEIKNEDHFKYLKRTGPEPDHVSPQATLYSLCLGINYVLFLYVGRNYKHRKSYLVEITDAMREEQRLRVKMAWYCARNGIVPMKETHTGCRYCNFKKTCKTDAAKTQEGLINLSEVRDYAIN